MEILLKTKTIIISVWNVSHFIAKFTFHIEWPLSSSSSSCHAINADIPGPLSPSLSIVHCFWLVFGAASRIATDLLYVVLAGCPSFVRPCEGVHRSTSLMSSSRLLQQSPACLVCLILIVFVIGDWWPYSCCFVGCCLQDFNIARNILV